MTKKDAQYYRMIIRDSEQLLPIVTTTTFLCKHKKTSKWLKKIIKRVTEKNHVDIGTPYNFTTITRRDSNYGYESFKSDRIFLLQEIIRYCQYKLNNGK